MAMLCSITLLLAAVLLSNGFTFPSIGGLNRRSHLKADILKLARETKRGIEISPEQEEKMRQLFQQLERLNPTKKPLQSSQLIDADWSLEYSTAGYIIGKGDFPRVGPIVQKIDTKNLVAENSETVSYFGIPVPRKVTAQLIPQNDRLTNVQFKKFSVGPIGIRAPEQFKGFLDITYLDEDLRLTRGDKGNLFVLTRMD